MSTKTLFITFFYLTLGSFILAQASKDWTEVSKRWPAAAIEYFVATEHGHHFIDIKLPEQIDNRLNVRLEYYYNYGKVRPDVRFVPCGTSLEVVSNEVEQPKGQWLVHEYSIEPEACRANPILVYNVLLHEAGDVFAWRIVEAAEEETEVTTTSTSVAPINQWRVFCRPSLCNERLFKHPRFKSLTNGLPDSAVARLDQGVKVYLNLKKESPFRLAFKAGKQQEEEKSVDQTKVDTCFRIELYMNAGTELELSIASSNNSIKPTEVLEVIKPNQDADQWFSLKRCVTDFLPRLPTKYNETAMFQFKPKGKSDHSYIFMALKPLGREQASTWYETLAHDTEGFQNQWFLSTTGGSRVGQEMLVEYLGAEGNDYKLRVSGIDPEAESLEMTSNWMKWRDGDENSWLQASIEQADWISSVEFGWQDESGQWLQTKSYEPQAILEASVSADSGASSNNLIIRYRLEGMVGREYRLRLKLKLKHDEQAAGDDRLRLLVNSIALIKSSERPERRR